MSDTQMKAESDQDKCESEKSNTPEAQQSSIKDPKPKGDVMDVFKQFATTTGPSWADMMVEEQREKELKELELRTEEAEKLMKNIREPYIVHLTNLYIGVTAEDLFYFFGGNEAIADLYSFDDYNQALVEFNTREALKNALMKNGVEFFKKKLVIKILDHNKLLQVDNSRQAPEPHRQSQSNVSQYSRDRDRQDRDRQGRMNKGRTERGQPSRQYDNRSYNNRTNDNRFPKHQQSNDVRYSQHIPSLLGNPNDARDYREDSAISTQKLEAPRPPVEVQPSKPKPSPFGDAKPSDKVYENMQRQMERIEIEKEQDQIKLNEQKRLQKKASISSQHSQFTNDESITDDQKQAKSIESKSNEASESEKKPYSSNSGRNRKGLQHSRSDFTGHSRSSQKINVQHVKRYLPKPLDVVKEDKPKYRKSSDTGFTSHISGQERKYGKNRFERKNSSTGSHPNITKNGSKEILKQSSVDRKTPPPSTPISNVPLSTSNSSVEDTAVSTPTNADPSNSNPSAGDTPSSSATKSKKSKSNKKKKNSATTLGSGMFGALEEVRD